MYEYAVHFSNRQPGRHSVLIKQYTPTKTRIYQTERIFCVKLSATIQRVFFF